MHIYFSFFRNSAYSPTSAWLILDKSFISWASSFILRIRSSEVSVQAGLSLYAPAPSLSDHITITGSSVPTSLFRSHCKHRKQCPHEPVPITLQTEGHCYPRACSDHIANTGSIVSHEPVPITLRTQEALFPTSLFRSRCKHKKKCSPWAS